MIHLSDDIHEGKTYSDWLYASLYGLDGKVVIDVREVRWVRIVLNRRLQVLEGKLVLLLGVPRETALVVELRVLGRLSFKH